MYQKTTLYCYLEYAQYFFIAGQVYYNYPLTTVSGPAGTLYVVSSLV